MVVLTAAMRRGTMGLLDRLRRAPSTRTVEVPYVSANGKNAVHVVGESHYQDALNEVCGGKTEGGHNRACHAVLVRDSKNQYDGNAIGIQIEGRPVGHISRGDAARYAPVLDRAKCRAVAVDALIRGGWDRGGSEHGHYGVTLDLPTPEEVADDLR